MTVLLLQIIKTWVGIPLNKSEMRGLIVQFLPVHNFRNNFWIYRSQCEDSGWHSRCCISSADLFSGPNRELDLENKITQVMGMGFDEVRISWE